jgi:Ca-activated chloride channel family protein
MQDNTHHGAQALALVLSPLRAGIPAAGGTLEVLVRVQAPAQPETPAGSGPAPRLPLRLAVVVDRSGSMSGQPLDEALLCVDHIASHLQPSDQIAVVLYDDHVQVPVPLRPANDLAMIRSALQGVTSGGSTDLHAGWQEGFQQLSSPVPALARETGSLSRVILLSDGQANAGLVEPASIEAACAAALSAGISTTTVGLGRAFHEELMLGMASAGGGQQYYGQLAQDLMDGFDQELSLLQALCGRGLRLTLVPAPGVVVEPLGVVQQGPDGRFALSDLAWGAEAWMMVRLHVSAAVQQAGIGEGAPTRALLSATVQASDLQGLPVTAHSPVMVLPAFDHAAHALLPVDGAVASRLQEVQFSSGAQQVHHLLREGKAAEAGGLAVTGHRAPLA